VFIDDATGRLTVLRFAPVESGQGHLETLRDHVLAHGCPLALYSDRHGIFRVNAKDAQSGDGKAEFGRAVERLEIRLINALTPQAKGRVERANQTLQDRLVKEMRLRNIGSIAAAQAYLPEFILGWNEKFAVEPRDAVSAHRPWTKTAEDLDLVLACQEQRVLSKALTFSYGGTKYCVKMQGPGTAMRGAKIAVHRFTDGRLRFSYKDRVLICTAYGSYAVPDRRKMKKHWMPGWTRSPPRASDPPSLSPHWLPEPVPPTGAPVCHAAHCGEGPVLVVLAMLALKGALRVAPGGSAPPIPFAPRHDTGCSRPGRESRLFSRTRKLDRDGFTRRQRGHFYLGEPRGHFYFALTQSARLVRGRSRRCALIVFIDDATGRLSVMAMPRYECGPSAHFCCNVLPPRPIMRIFSNAPVNASKPVAKTMVSKRTPADRCECLSG
jgi:hypothetical protein